MKEGDATPFPVYAAVSGSIADHDAISIEDELVSYMRGQPKAIAPDERDVQIVLSWYGLRSVARPTLEEVGAEFALTRERVRQLLETFRTRIGKKPLPVLAQVSELLHQQYCIRGDDFSAILASYDLIWPAESLQGLLLLLQEAGVISGISLYTPSFQRVTRGIASDPASVFLVHDDEAKVLRGYFKAATDLPGMLGVANLQDLSSRHHWPLIRCQAIKSAIKASTVAWFDERETDFWYVFENRANTLIGYFAKVFAVVAAADVRVLAHVFQNALRARSNEYDYPPHQVIETYLRASIHLKVNGDIAVGAGPEEILTDVEQDIVQFFATRAVASFPELSEFLEQRGHEKPLIVKSAMTSPIVQVDRSGGRLHYMYRLVPPAQARPLSPHDALRYELFLDRLRGLLEEGTDEDVEGTRRKEQGILQDWLFAGKKIECCAMCGRTFAVRALVTAHKKKRSECVPSERLDPHVVMPLCTFGCDFLYERGYIYFDGFSILVNEDLAADTSDYEGARALGGRQLQEKWRAGGSKYLRRAPLPQ